MLGVSINYFELYKDVLIYVYNIVYNKMKFIKFGMIKKNNKKMERD